MENNKILALVDADSLIYQSSKETLEESIAILNDKIENIFKETKATHYVLFLSSKKTFRHDIDSLYKANRKKSVSPLKWLKTLRAYLVENYNATQMNNIEADDLCAYWMNQDICISDDISESMFETKEGWESVNCILSEDNKLTVKYESIQKVLCAVDKDLLQSISGKHFNYTYRIKEESKNKPKEELTDDDFNKGWWVKTTIDEAITFKWIQMIMGDTTDGIKGIEGKGIKYATKVYSDEGRTFQDICLQEYINKYGLSQGVFEFQKNYRLLHLLDCDSDFIREVGKLPLLPNIQEVSINSLETETLEF